MIKRTIAAGAILLSIGISSSAFAGVITSATGATASSTWGAANDIARSIDQSGLSTGFTSGVTDFATYLASNPTHGLLGSNDWFSASGVTRATVTYDLGSTANILGMALWNEEFAGFGSGAISTSTDGVIFNPLSVITPFDNPVGFDYGAEVFDFGSVLAQYVRIELSGCPQPASGGLNICGIGEVAFDVGTVPAPAALGFLVFGLAGLGAARRRRSTK